MQLSTRARDGFVARARGGALAVSLPGLVTLATFPSLSPVSRPRKESDNSPIWGTVTGSGAGYNKNSEGGHDLRRKNRGTELTYSCTDSMSYMHKCLWCFKKYNKNKYI